MSGTGNVAIGCLESYATEHTAYYRVEIYRTEWIPIPPHLVSIRGAVQALPSLVLQLVTIGLLAR